MLNDIIQLLGIANPQLSRHWTKNGGSAATTLPSPDTDGFTLNCDTADEWTAPFVGIVTEGQHHMLLQLPDGTTPSDAIVLQAAPQVYLALCRLYATIVEGKTASTNFPDRPVPKYFLYRENTKLNWTDNGESRTGPTPGLYQPGEQLHIHGKLTIHDEEGILIDPLAVAAVFNLFLQTHWSLESKLISSATPTGSTAPPFTQPAQRQINNLAATGSNQTRVYLTDIYNKPFEASQNPLNNITGVSGNNSLFTVNAIATAITKTATADAQLQFGISTNGLFANTLTTPALAGGVILARDFFRIKLVNWTEHLLGDVPATEPTKANNVLPEIRDNEAISFCFNGNECLGEVNNILSAGSVEQLVSSTTVETDFSLPPAPDGTGNHLWPAFAEGIATNNTVIPSGIKSQLNASANFISDAATNNTDVYLEISATDNSLQNGWAVRVFHRIFHPDGRETRGDGGGTIVQNNIAAFRLKDPLGINKAYGVVNIPTEAILMVDMVIINSASPIQSRRIGNIVTNIQPASAATPNLLVRNNTINTAGNIGIMPGGFLGVKTSPDPISVITNITSYLLASGSEAQPRQSPVLPTQSRLEGIVAARRGNDWFALHGGLQLKKLSRENFLVFGNPGSPGGNDTHTTGLKTSAGRLAYDIARAAFRRARNISERMSRLISNSNFALPGLPNATGRTFIAAVLQTIAKKTESPRLEEFQQSMNNLPADANALSNDIQQLLNSDTKPGWLPPTIKDQFKTAMAGTSAASDHTLALQELRREYSSSINGRRDSFFSIKHAIEQARHFIYIETTFFGPSKYPISPTPQADDLVEIIKQQLIAKPGLKLMLCLAEEIPFNRGYENIARFHKKNRHDSIIRLLGNRDSTTHKFERQNQVVAYHPIAFPGRPIKLNTQCIIIDDVYGIMGSSNFNQRGLFFDGSTDVVFCDKQLRGGKSVSLKNLRKQLMLQYIRTDDAALNFPSSNQVFLQDGRAAFEMMRSLIDGGGAAMIREFVAETLSGISEPELTALNNLADPNGDTFYQSQALLNTWLAALSTVPE